jgi:5-methyltetrahydropteroyltriglutamate--homocysteine methyltransferase
MKRLKVAQFLLEFSIPVAGDVAVLRELPPNMMIGLGCVDVRFTEIETPETIAERVEKALAYVAPDCLSLDPDCGFGPGKDHEIPLEEAHAKLKNLAGAARLLREKYFPSGVA